MTVSLPELIERKRHLEMEIAEIDRVIEAKALYSGKVRTRRLKSPVVPLMFGKNVITWGNGKALYIKGKGYKFVKSLYEVDKMRLKEATLDKIVWEGKVNHRNFREFVRRLAEKLEKAEFPYRLKTVMSRPQIIRTGEIRNNKPVLRFVPPEIIGVKLHATVNCGKEAGT